MNSGPTIRIGATKQPTDGTWKLYVMVPPHLDGIEIIEEPTKYFPQDFPSQEDAYGYARWYLLTQRKIPVNIVDNYVEYE